MFLALPDATTSANPAILSIAIPFFLPLWTSWDLQKGQRICSSDPHLSVPTSTSNVCANEVSEKDWCIGSLIERPGIIGKRLTDILGLRMKTDPNQRTQDLKLSSTLTPQMSLLPYPTLIHSSKAFLLAHRPICGQGYESDERFSKARYIHIMRAHCLSGSPSTHGSLPSVQSHFCEVSLGIWRIETTLSDTLFL